MSDSSSLLDDPSVLVSEEGASSRAKSIFVGEHFAELFLTFLIILFSILEKYIKILFYLYLQICYKKDYDFTVRISENIKLLDGF